MSLSVGAAPVYGALNGYWGQRGGHYLRDICDSGVQYATISFVTKSPEQAGGYPATNFGANCAPFVYDIDGKDSQLLSGCNFIQRDIPYCQSKGVKVLLSIGGQPSETTNYKVSSVNKGIEFAEFLYNAFGPHKESWNGPRPFDISATEHISIDGFDLDLEDDSPDFQNEPYIAMVDWWRKQSKDLFISAAPQCVLNNNKNDELIAKAKFDAIFVQFYNNPVCDAIPGNTEGDEFSYDKFTKKVQSGKSKDAKVFIGLPAAPTAGSGYINPEQLKDLVCEYKSHQNFGGISLWDATFGLQNKDSKDKAYLLNALDALSGGCKDEPTTTLSKITSSSTPTASITSSVGWSNGTTTHATVPMTTSTVYATKTYTITSCAPTVTKCPVGKVTTEVVPAYTTVCPVKNTPGVGGASSSSLQTVTRSTVGAPHSSLGCNGPQCPGVAVPTEGWNNYPIISASARPSAPVTAGASSVALGMAGLIAMAAVQVLMI